MLPHFHTLYLETTRSCNLHCTYCSTGSNGKCESAGDITYDQILYRILTPAAEIGTRFVHFSGGEFLMRKDSSDLLHQANNMGFHISVVSNGTTLNEKMVRKLKSILGDNLLVSLGINSFDAENPKTRQTYADFILKKIHLLEMHGIRINLSVTIGEFNKHTFLDTVQRIHAMGLPFNRIPFVVRNCRNYELMYDSDMMREYFHPVLRKYFNGCVSYTPFLLNAEHYENVSGQNEKDNRVPTNPSVGCWCGSFYAINPEGEVSICPLLLDHVSAGNVLTEELNSILKDSELFKGVIRRDRINGRCGKCKYRFTCGGCRAMAYYKSGKVFDEDPTCFIAGLSGDELLAIEKETRKSFDNYVRMAGVGKTYFAPSASSEFADKH